MANTGALFRDLRSAILAATNIGISPRTGLFDQAGWGMECRHHQSPRLDCGSIAEGSRRDAGGPFPLRVFGCLLCAGVGGCTEAGVRKASKEETAGEFAPEVVSGYGDLMRGVDSPGCFRTGTLGE
jgi:hypothetical protein